LWRLKQLHFQGRTRTYDWLEFLPYLKESSTEARTFNLFTGFRWPYQPTKPPGALQYLQVIITHIEQVLCNGHPQISEYALHWLAHLIPKPWEKPGVCVCFQSEQGSGKSIFWGWMAKVIGERWHHVVNDLEHLTGRFNKRNEVKLLCILDEVSNFGGSFHSNDRLKKYNHRVYDAHRAQRQRSLHHPRLLPFCHDYQ